MEIRTEIQQAAVGLERLRWNAGILMIIVEAQILVTGSISMLLYLHGWQQWLFAFSHTALWSYMCVWTSNRMRGYYTRL